METKQTVSDQTSGMGFSKGSFGYKMSKKVAELTQVVHMLFTRNHEREVELDELKDVYEKEISDVIQDAKSRIEKLEYQLRDAERKRKRETDEVSSNVSKLLREAQERMESMKNEILEEKKQNTHLRDLLTQAHRDLEILKQGSTGVSGDLQKKSKILEEREREYQSMWQNYNELEARFVANSKYTDDVKKQLDNSQETVRRSKLQMEKILKAVEEKKKIQQELLRKIKMYEDEIKSLKREINRKTKEVTKERDNSSRDAEWNGDVEDKKYWKEIEKLRRENEWLRNEIRNREGNFNRVFASFQPVFVKSGSNPRHHIDVSQERDMMMVTPISSFNPPAKSEPHSFSLSPTNFGSFSGRRRTPNLTGLEPRIQSMVPTPTPLRPKTKEESRYKESFLPDNAKPNKNFRLIFTK